jgi:CP family cyanate transporter-like MFS transporter
MSYGQLTEDAPVPSVRGTLGAAWLSAFNCRAPLVAAGPLLPLMMRALNLSGAISGLLTGVPLLLMAALSLPAGVLGDRFGPRRLLAVAQGGILAAGIARAFAGSAPALLLATAGLGAAIGLAQPALTQIAQGVGREAAGRATAVYTAGLMLGSLAATSLSVPWLLPWLASWRAVLLAWALPAGAAAIWWLLLRVEGSRPPRPALGADGFIALGRYPGTDALSLTFAAQSIVFYGLVTWLPAFYRAQGATLQGASLPESMLSLGSLAGALVTPVLLARTGGVKRPMLWAGVATAVGIVGFLTVPGLGVLWALLAGAATAVAFSLGLATPAIIAEPGETGRLAGTVMAIGYGATVLGPLAVGTLHDVTGGYLAGFLVLLAASGMIIAGTRGLPRTTASLRRA